MEIENEENINIARLKQFCEENAHLGDEVLTRIVQNQRQLWIRGSKREYARAKEIEGLKVKNILAGVIGG